MEKIDSEALFIGPSSENRKFFKDMLNFMIDEHIYWRRNFHPEDPPMISLSEQNRSAFIETQQRIQEALLELSSRLKSSSVPWHSPRYLGHMNTDLLIPAVIGYMATILYNPNNCAYEGSPATTELEIEVVKDFAKMLGYNHKKYWGHLTTGGTLANIESLWVARNLKSIPMAIKRTLPHLVEGMTEWELMNMPTEQILSLINNVPEELLDSVYNRSVRGEGIKNHRLGKVLIAQSRHYSWDKAIDLLGIGKNNVVWIKVDNKYRTDIKDLKNKISFLHRKGIPTLAVIGIIGSTEEGAIDQIDQMVELRQYFKEKYNYSFYIHVDAAFGGYIRSIFIDENNQFMEYEQLRNKIKEYNYIHELNEWPTLDIYKAIKATEMVDSITIDPHKLGYVPYMAAAILYQYKDLRKLISFFASYIENKHELAEDKALGSYDLMGTKAGAIAAAVWTSNRAIPLNFYGYGKIISHSIEGALHFNFLLNNDNIFYIKGRKLHVESLTLPDCNIIVFAFNIEENHSLELMNLFNRTIYKYSSYQAGPLYKNDFITSKTVLYRKTYGDAPLSFLRRLSIPDNQWYKIQELFVLRACILTPYLGKIEKFDAHIAKIINAINLNIEKAIDELGL